MTQFRFKVINGSEQFYTDWFDEDTSIGNSNAVSYVQTLRMSYPDATFSVERRAGTGGSVVSNTSALSSDLQLNGFNLVGQLNSSSLLIDGGTI